MTSLENELTKLYHSLITAWNNRNAREMADQFTEQGIQIGFDGSKLIGQKEIYSHLQPIFEDHPTAPYVTKIKDIRSLGPDAALLTAIAGMVPEGKTEVNPQLNTHLTVAAVRKNGEWKIELFQNTPAQFHGRPELVEEMTQELNQLIK